MRRRAAVTLLAAALLAGCRVEHVPNGTWGGEGASVEVTDDGARVRVECGHGAISHPLALDDQGRFNLVGTFRPETARGDDAAESRPARYQGRVERDRLEFTVTLEGQTARGPYTVALGKAAELEACKVPAAADAERR